MVENSKTVGAYLEAGLNKLKEKYDVIGDVRGYGMMLGVAFIQGGNPTGRDGVDPNDPHAANPDLRDKVEYRCYEKGLIILGCGYNAIRWSPPLILTKEHVDVALEIFDQAIADDSESENQN